MHRSRLSTILIDSPLDEAQQSAAFWSAALGVEAEQGVEEPQYTSLRGVHPDFSVAVQSVDDAPRYHFDIETDDHDAETARLVALGAVEVNRWLDCHTLRVPGGQLVCVIPRHSDEEVFDRLAHTWE
jgi:hypothetical protein